MILPKYKRKDIYIKGLKTNYTIDTLGNVRNKRGKLLKASGDNYRKITLNVNSKRYYYLLHRLVALTYIPNPNNYPCVNHKDEDKTNNCVDNLEWCTYEYNNSYGTRGKRISKALTNRDTKHLMGGNNPKAKKVILLNTKEIFGSAVEAKAKYDCKVEEVCRGSQKTTKSKVTGEKLIFMYYSDYLKTKEGDNIE